MNKPFSIAIHGGAGTILREQMSDSLQQAILTDLEAAAKAGHQILANGGASLDAVVAAVKVLEDSPHFNAGKGSVLTHNEMVEMDASIMDGSNLAAGAVAGVRHIKNPIELARDVMQKSNHVLLVGEGAETFAFENGHQYTEQDYFFTDRRYEQLISMREKGEFALSESRYPDDRKHGTVGAVALDQHGNLAAATSTGGVTNKKYGRIGDSALIGCGTVAENGVVAVSTTGMGEFFIRKRVAEDVAARIRYLKEDVHTACETVIQGDLKAMGGEGGLIAIDAEGELHFAMNSSGMYRAGINTQGELSVKIYADE
ncbi:MULTISPECIES: isoaspartyl peptidase/L-asparaginase family protein [Vibrio]|jgi:beta-aspartyl-peptidase (threonine type)|uniref:Isoaspartyl peptidase n=1 Tax=Vibrio natriegens NBRC 15636 = ATCC 14048 = DSM 759 TaxID=1219067 RepID=A0AAN1CWG0_VIBNA|nr:MULTISPECIES: isoaspartyl peptidase/L-asparaginase [Vibrio]AEX23317.1 L-asparaginase [Vibrio sp. EJY3]ALR17115.1 peptidase [Vibrio natriegens NBRC 15636 = ATCC 14048 = DSM 759]ANQ13687.1 peptidase [Vibrio natriegens NBRC 15636 = ATCC 14048 = DSM 759]AXT72027.1 isoaspartyl peptidase/L-asparaginase [Vibrio sp. dhg]EPM38566.1 peptidase [Vibrio natriegens NBRC 15636 = ATCC 14048 = DSM 759]